PAGHDESIPRRLRGAEPDRRWTCLLAAGFPCPYSRSTRRLGDHHGLEGSERRIRFQPSSRPSRVHFAEDPRQNSYKIPYPCARRPRGPAEATRLRTTWSSSLWVGTWQTWAEARHPPRRRSGRPIGGL